MRPEIQRRKQRSRERKECPVHLYQRHGKEAEELRKGLEKLMAGAAEQTRDFGYAVNVADLQKLLDTVDARDSLAYLERCEADVRRRRGSMTRTGAKA